MQNSNRLMLTLQLARSLFSKPTGPKVKAKVAPPKPRKRSYNVRVKLDPKAEAVTARVVASRKQTKPLTSLALKQRALRDNIVLEHLPLVKVIAIRIHQSLPVVIELDDLVQAGIFGLLDAANKYDPKRQVVFCSYAKHRIKGAIMDSLRELDWASRDMRRRHKAVEAAKLQLALVLERDPTEAELAEKLGIDLERWRVMMIDLQNVGLVSADTRRSENENLPAPDFPDKLEILPDHMFAREELRSVLGNAILKLPERYQKVVALYYTNELTMKEIGDILNINESRVSQIHKIALKKMQFSLAERGVTSPACFYNPV